MPDHYRVDVLLSDRDIQAQLAAGRVVLEPRDPAMVQPSSVDVRLDRFFRLFDNHKYAVIDPAEDQPELTRLVEVKGDEPFILHPGEFVLGATYEAVTLPDDLAARLEGKALALDTRVPVPGGWKTMGELEVGDQVFGIDGKPVDVVAVTPPMLDRPCREVELKGGARFVADALHQWVTTTKRERRAAKGRGEAPPVVSRTTDEIASSLKAGIEYNHQVPLAAPVEHPTAELLVDPYTLGLWLGDGTSSCADITVGDSDVEVLDHVRAAGYQVWPRGRMKYRVGGVCEGNRNRDRDEFGRFCPDGSLNSTLTFMRLLGNKHVPREYLVADASQRLALLQGLMDSDGYVDVYGRCEFVNMRESLSDAVYELAASLGMRPTRRKKRAMLNGVDCGPAFQVKFSPRVPVFRLQRKLARLKGVSGVHHAHRAVLAVREVPSVPVRCIEVSAPDGVFLVGEAHVPTHNSSLGRLGLLTHSTAGFIDPGFSGHVTLELSNVATLPIKLWPGMKIGQLCFFKLSSPAEHPYGSAEYGSRYQGQRGPTASRSFLRFHRTDVSAGAPAVDA